MLPRYQSHPVLHAISSTALSPKAPIINREIKAATEEHKKRLLNLEKHSVEIEKTLEVVKSHAVINNDMLEKGLNEIKTMVTNLMAMQHKGESEGEKKKGTSANANLVPQAKEKKNTSATANLVPQVKEMSDEKLCGAIGGNWAFRTVGGGISDATKIGAENFSSMKMRLERIEKYDWKDIVVPETRQELKGDLEGLIKAARERLDQVVLLEALEEERQKRGIIIDFRQTSETTPRRRRK